MKTDTEIVFNIRQMYQHFIDTLNHYEQAYVLGDVEVLRDWTEQLLGGRDYDWRSFINDVLASHYWDGALSQREWDKFRWEAGLTAKK